MEVWGQRFDPAVPLSSLVRYPGNPRRGDVEVIADSVGVNGFYGAVLVQSSTRRILYGNHRADAAAARGLSSLPVLFIDCDDDIAARILIIDNRSADAGTYDAVALARLLGGLRDAPGGLAGTGYDADTVDLLLRQLAEGLTSGAVGTGATPAEREATRVATQSLVLPFPPDVHAAVVRALDAACTETGLDRSTMVAVLAREAVADHDGAHA